MILPLTPVRFKRHAARVYGSKVGVTCDDLCFTYRDFNERCDRLSAALLRLPVANWPILGGMGNASWVQLSGHSDNAATGPEGFDGIRWRLDVWNASAQVSNDVL
jgi:hypothetical protein